MKRKTSVALYITVSFFNYANGFGLDSRFSNRMIIKAFHWARGTPLKNQEISIPSTKKKTHLETTNDTIFCMKILRQECVHLTL
jgi:hypothetical protein